MPDIEEREVSQLFQVVRGKSAYTLAHIRKNKGPYPVHSAATQEPLGNASFWDYEGAYLTVTLNGYAGYVQKMEGRFSVNGDRAVLVPREPELLPDLDFLRSELQRAFRPLAVGRIVDGTMNEYTKLSPEAAESATIRIPVTQSGEDDYQEMQRLGNKLRRLESLQANLVARATQIEDTSVVINLPEKVKSVELSDTELFRLSIGKRYLKKDLTSDGVPVFSANVQKPFGFTTSAGSLDFTHPSLIWGIDGEYDWAYIPAMQPFVPTDHCGRLELLTDQIVPEYLLWVLKTTRSEYGFDRVFRANLANVGSVTALIPTDQNGCFDVECQGELAARFRRVDQLRQRASTSIRDLTSLTLDLFPGEASTRIS